MLYTVREADKQRQSQSLHLVEEDMCITLNGYRHSTIGTTIYWSLVVLTAGALYILDTWIHTIYIKVALSKSPLSTAEYIQIQCNHKHTSLEKTSLLNMRKPLSAMEFSLPTNVDYNQTDLSREKSINGQIETRVFLFRHYRFIYHHEFGQYVLASTWKDSEWTKGNCTRYSGLSNTEYQRRLELFGSCIIDIQESSYLRLLWEEVLNPFYIFQLISIGIWCMEEYYYYSIVIFVISIISITSTLITTKRTMKRIRQMATYILPVRVLRNGSWLDIMSDDLVPGDIVDLSDCSSTLLPCEMLLLEGDCIVNESMLTGESVPESKYPISSSKDILENIDLASHTLPSSISRHVLFAGTQLVRARKAHSRYQGSNEIAGYTGMRTTAMVFRTGFCTTKGTLVRSILFPQSTAFRFYRDAFRFIGVLAIVAMIGFIVNTINLYNLGVSAFAIVKKALDLFTVVVPPALPASMSIGMAFAASRLRKQRIFCTSPSRINVASKVAAVCFDKTGTLTEEGLDLLGICAVDLDTGLFAETCSTIEQVDKVDRRVVAGFGRVSIIHALATCHSLRLVNGLPVGDPLEIKMVEFAGWQLEETEDMLHCQPSAHNNNNNNNNNTNDLFWPPATIANPPVTSVSQQQPVGIAKVFEFSSTLRRSSVIVQLPQNFDTLYTYTKGAPEVILQLCDPETIPRDYEQTLDQYTLNGYRVIAMAGKPLKKYSAEKLARLERTKVESNLEFMAFLVFENRVKTATVDVLDELRDARIRMIMCTGDNILTAVSVARSCSLVPAGTRVFVPQFVTPLTNTAVDLPVQSPMTRIMWTESTGESVGLDPLTLTPYSTDPSDFFADQMAGGLALSGRYCLAITGEVFSYLRDNSSSSLPTWKNILMRGVVYARMSPELKAELVSHLQCLGYITAFCGDGANDCAALKMADVGISLSEAEASVAAPFTSHHRDISSMSLLLKEGRCSIATSFACFKFMALYSMIQFTSCCIFYVYNINLTDGQFLFIDLFTILPIAICMDRTKPFDKLVAKRPSASLVSKKVLTSLIGNVILVVVFQIAVFLVLRAQAWYEKPHATDPSDPDSIPIKGVLNTTIFVFSVFQYVFAGLIFSIGPPYRQPVYRNYIYLAVITVLLAFDLWVLLGPVPGFTSLFGIVHLKVWWRLFILGMVAANLVLCVLGEWLVFPMVARPLAKIFRLFGYLFDRYGCAWQGEKLSDEEAHLHYYGRSSKTAADASLWSRLGQRRNRKEYKVLLESMPGGSSFY